MTDPAVEKIAVAKSVEQAVLLTTAGVFDARWRHRSGDAGPSTMIGGLTVFLRGVLTLQRAGIKELLVLAGDEEKGLRESVQRDRRVTAQVRWMPVREFPPDDVRTWETLGGEIQGACLIVGGRTLFSLGLLERLLREHSREGEATLVVTRAQNCESLTRTVNPAVRMRGDRAIAVYEPLIGIKESADAFDGSAADLAVLPGHLLRAAGSTRTASSLPPLRAALEQAIAEERVRTVLASPESEQWCQDVRDPVSVQAVERRLLRSPQRELDGFVDTYFNRPVSEPFTRAFLKLGLTPNAITSLSIGIGLIAAASFAVGTYTASLVGALLFQLSAVLDCCDGEVARVTFRESPFGAQLDIIGDNVVHMGIFAGIAWALFQRGSADPSWIPLAWAGAAILGTALSLVLVKRATRVRHVYASSHPQRVAPLSFILKNVASRDFTVAVLVFALADMLDWFLLFAAIGSNVFWMAMAILTRPSSSVRD